MNMNMLGGVFGGGGGGTGTGMGFGPMTMGFGGHGHAPAPPSAFNRPYRAYSSAIHEIQQGRGNAGAHVTDGGRTQVMFGGQSAQSFLAEDGKKSVLMSLLLSHDAPFCLATSQ